MDEEQEFLVEAARERERQVAGAAGGVQAEDPAIQSAIDYANETAGQGPEPGSGEPGFLGLGGLSSAGIEAQQQDIAATSYAAPEGGVSTSVPADMAAPMEDESIDTPQEFFAAAQQMREEQVRAAGTPEQADPAIRDAIDYANQTAGQGPEPGSGEPGLLGLGGLSSAEIEAQQQNIAEESYRGS